MFNYFITVLKDLPLWALLTGLVGFPLYLVLLFSNKTLFYAVGIFVIVQCFSTAENFRISVPLLGYLPGIVALLLLIGLVFKRRPYHLTSLVWCWLFITVWFTFRLLLGLYGVRAVTYGIYYLVISMMALLLGFHVAVYGYLERFIKVMSVTGAIIALILLADFFISGRSEAFRTGRLASYGLQANILGPTCAVFVLYCLGYVLIGSFEKVKIFRITLLCITTTTAILTFSRSTIFPMTAGILMLLFLGGVKHFKIILYSVLIGFGLYFIFFFIVSHGYMRGGQWERIFQVSLSQRDVYIENIWDETLKDHLILGQGFYGTEGGGGTLKHGDPHNSYLNLLAEQGVLGLLVVMVFHAIVLIFAFQLWRSSYMTRVDIYVLRYSAISIFVYLIIALAVPNLWLHNTIMAFDLMVKIGVILGMRQMFYFGRYEYYPQQAFDELLSGNS